MKNSRAYDQIKTLLRDININNIKYQRQAWFSEVDQSFKNRLECFIAKTSF